MNCMKMSENGLNRSLVLDVDLRVKPSVRLDAIAPKIISMNDALGVHHLSISLAYKEGERTQHVNLPVYVSETETERILQVVFPQGTYVNIQKDEQIDSIDSLRYRVDKLTEVVTEETGLSEDYKIGPQFNIIDVDCDLYHSDHQSFIMNLGKQYPKIKDKNLPIIIRFFKDNVTYFEQGLRAFMNKDGMYEIWAYVYNKEIDEDLGGNLLRVQFKEPVGVISPFREYNEEAIALYEDNDGVISTSDKEVGTSNGHGWKILYDALLHNKRPLLMLKTRDSGGYCPVTYDFKALSSDPTKFVGYVEIRYLKVIENQTYLIVDRKDFDVFTGVMSMYEVYNHEPKKYLLGTPVTL